MKTSSTGHILLEPEKDVGIVVDWLIANDYFDDFCLCLNMEGTFVSRLMAAGFLVMSTRMRNAGVGLCTVLLPKLHRQRLVVRPAAVHEPRSIRHLLGRYELRPLADFETILQGCVQTHGDDWLTPELCSILLDMHRISMKTPDSAIPVARPISFALYREGALVAGEFGIRAGNAYTSYSGFRLENSAGTVQLVLTGRYLKESGFSLWDLGMPMDYKERLGAKMVERSEFIALFRAARSRG